MRISTIQIHKQNIKQIMDQQKSVNETHTQISTGQRINKPSDDPNGYANLILINQHLAQTERYQQHADMAEGRLQLEESILTGFTTTLQRVRELNVQAGNSTLSNEDRASIGSELQVHLDQLVGLANSQDATGAYMFSGFQTEAKTIIKDATGSYIYNGDSGERFSKLGSDLEVQTSDSGFETFINIPNGNGRFVVTDPGAANTGTGVTDQGSVTDSSAYVKDVYTLSFVTNSAGDLAYTVVGAAGGQVVPALPGVMPDDAPAYVDGQSIGFKGMELEVTGSPAVGDNFQTSPSSGQSVFQTIDKVITALKSTPTTEAERASVQNALNRNLVEMDQVIDNVLIVRTQIGSRLSSIEQARDVNENITLHDNAVLSSIQDLDYAEAISRLNLQTTVLQAAQQSYIRIQGLNLFNYLG